MEYLHPNIEPLAEEKTKAKAKAKTNKTNKTKVVKSKTKKETKQKKENEEMNEEINLLQQRRRWTKGEHVKFLEGLQLFPNDLRRISQHVGTRTNIQVGSHYQKYKKALAKEKHMYRFLDKKNEVWKFLTEFPGYKVSNFGRVKNKKEQLVGCMNHRNEKVVYLWNKNKQRVRKLVKDLLVECFPKVKAKESRERKHLRREEEDKYKYENKDEDEIPIRVIVGGISTACEEKDV